MRKLSCILIFLGCMLLAYSVNDNTSAPLPSQNPDEDSPNLNYTGSLYKDNYVWGGAMNLAWNELSDNIIKSKIRLNTTDPFALATLDKLNNPVMTKQDLDKESYFIKCGLGPKTLSQINRKCKKKKITKSFGDLALDVSAEDVISYAYLLKEVLYAELFESGISKFKGKSVLGFFADDASRGNIYILDYQDDDHFLIGIKLQDQADQVFLAKGYPMDKPDSVVIAIRTFIPCNVKLGKSLGAAIKDEDTFGAPDINLDMKRTYPEMINKELCNKGFHQNYIVKMFENIKFTMGNKATRGASEVCCHEKNDNMAGGGDSPKCLILNKPYWVVMKRYNSNNPYFILGVNNTNLMTLTDDPNNEYYHGDVADQ